MTSSPAEGIPRAGTPANVPVRTSRANTTGVMVDRDIIHTRPGHTADAINRFGFGSREKPLASIAQETTPQRDPTARRMAAEAASS